ncbi:unnamed protein product [Rhizoctonia solani]|uniref:Cellobiose dehydrogenase-like cytochrome domain-containing protein n=1 Tax=Rhizoctonia solani TaxID=456999 RepID=A0A8H3E8U8_9AGAM|nr:unnamed protein product [Rhizoctonia solani]
MKLHSSAVHVGLFAIGAAWHATAATGGSFCGALGCVSGVVNGSETIYTMNTTASSIDVGWMAVGFGQGMSDSFMVIMWENDGELVLSQRKATVNAEPQALSVPPRVATVRADLSSLTGATKKFSFSISVCIDS